MGFSLGVQVISLAVAQGKVPPGVQVILAGDTMARNAVLLGQNAGIPLDTPNEVVMVVNEYDGWSDSPTKTGVPGYWAALWNATLGTQRLHYYANADPDNPANVVTRTGNITAVLIPTAEMPNGDEGSREQVNTAYDRPGSMPQARAAAAAEQVPQPNPPWPSKPEPLAAQ